MLFSPTIPVIEKTLVRHLIAISRIMKYLCEEYLYHLHIPCTGQIHTRILLITALPAFEYSKLVLTKVPNQHLYMNWLAHLVHPETYRKPLQYKNAPTDRCRLILFYIYIFLGSQIESWTAQCIFYTIA